MDAIEVMLGSSECVLTKICRTTSILGDKFGASSDKIETEELFSKYFIWRLFGPNIGSVPIKKGILKKLLFNQTTFLPEQELTKYPLLQIILNDIITR